MIKTNKYQNVAFDFDSTITALEGVDYLARLKGVEDAVCRLTTAAMNGEMDFVEALEARLNIIRPTRQDLVKLEQAYLDNLVPGVEAVMQALLSQGVNVFIVSGGYTQALGRTVQAIGLPAGNIYAIELLFDARGGYEGFDREALVCRADGKLAALQDLKTRYMGKWAVVGDGMTDYRAGQGADEFIYFGGVCWREAVAAKASVVIEHYDLWEVMRYL